MTVPFVLPTDLTLRDKLDAAREYQKAGDWDQTVKLLQTVLELREDTFFRQPYTDGAGKPAERWASTRAEADRHRRPAGRGKKLYDLNFNPLARKWLADARAANDMASLNDVVRRYGHTRAGADVLGLLGALHLDRGRFDLAAACYQRLSQQLPPERRRR